MKIIWSPQAKKDYILWSKTNKKTLNRINLLIEEIKKAPFEGIGKPEALKYNWAGYWSRRIDKEHRLVYRATKTTIFIAQCKYHY